MGVLKLNENNTKQAVVEYVESRYGIGVNLEDITLNFTKATASFFEVIINLDKEEN